VLSLASCPLPAAIREVRGDQVLRRIGQHDLAEAFMALETDGLHGLFPFNVAMKAAG